MINLGGNADKLHRRKLQTKEDNNADKCLFYFWHANASNKTM